jgi:hypothetical protein
MWWVAAAVGNGRQMLVANFQIKYTLSRIVMAGYQLLDTARLHPMRERNVRALASTVDYIERYMANAVGLETQKALIDYALRNVTVVGGHYLEFGVFKGGTIRYIAKRAPKAEIDGFDSFEGLPESWAGYNLTSQTFCEKGRLPSVPSNVTLHSGLFKDTIPVWRGGALGPIAFLHIDCDIYSSTVDILQGVRDRLQAGTIILFDEYFNYPGWQRHEFKAWQEFVAANNIRYEYLGFARQQALVRVSSIGTSALFDHIVAGREQQRRDRQSAGLSILEVD